MADGYNNTIRKVVIATGVATTVSGTAVKIGTTDGAAALSNQPRGITTDGKKLYVADKSNNTIRVIK